MSKKATESASPTPTDPGTSGTAPATPPATAAGTTRRRAYAPRISKKGDKNGLVKQKETELRDARMLDRLMAEIRDLSPWGLGQLTEMMKGLPVQPELVPTGPDPKNLNPGPGTEPEFGGRSA